MLWPYDPVMGVITLGVLINHFFGDTQCASGCNNKKKPPGYIV